MNTMNLACPCAPPPAATGAARPAAILAGAALCCTAALAQTQPEAPPPRTLEMSLSQGRLTAGLPDARAANVRGTWVFADGQVAGFEALEETKFDARGGVLAGNYTRTFGPDWYATATLALGHGGPNWAQQRVDLDVATKWGAARAVVIHLAVNGASYDNHRSDHGVRASVVAYLPGAVVLEGGILLNVSNPGAVNSHMPYASLTWGRAGVQYLSLRVSSGTEAYQALGASQQLVDFHSDSVALNWRRWVAPRWGFVLSAEQYRNPTYQRRTAGAGLLVQF
jgi:YaiO family outer membrane protein